MIISNEFKFTLNISNEGYEKKTDATCCLSSKGAEAINRKKMCFFENTLNVDEFLNKAQSGFSFCALYRFEEGKKYWYSNSKGQKFLGYPYYQRDSKTATKGGLKIDFKRDEYFSGSQVIFIDIDLTRFTDVNEYINTLTFKPTMVYMSYSDNKEKHGVISRRFHLCYVFDKILDKSTFKYCAETLSEALVKDTNEELDDKCGEKMSQYMNGCFGNKENYTTYSIYSVEDIHEYNKNMVSVIEDVEEDKCTTLNTELQKDQITEEQPISEVNDSNSIFDTKILNDWDRLDIEEFKKLRDWENYRRITKYYYRVEQTEWINGAYQKVNDDFFRLFWNRDTIKDGSKRRKGLFQRMCLRKVINPDITPMELVINTMIDIIRFYDNSDGLLNSDFIIRNVQSCLALTLEEINDRFNGEIQYLKNTTKPKRGIIYYNRKSHSKETTYSILDEYYINNLSVSENLDIINNDYGFIVSERTIYNYLNNRGIKTDKNKLSDDELKELTDITKTYIDNYNYIKSLGYKLGDKRYRKIYKEYVRECEEKKKKMYYNKY